MKYSIILAVAFIMGATGFTGLPSDPATAVAQSAPAPAEKPDLKIEGVENSYTVGDLIEIDAVLTGVDDGAEVKYDWKVRPEVEFKIWPDGSKILLGTGPKPTDFTIYLAVAALAKDGQTQILETRIDTATVTQEGEPVDGPAPENPEKADPKPPELGAFGKAAQELAKTVQITEFYSEDEYEDDLKLLSQNFRLIVTNAKSGKITTLDEALAKTREFNRNFGNRAIWTDWFNGVSSKLEEASKDGGLGSMDDVAGVWQDIANGLQRL